MIDFCDEKDMCINNTFFNQETIFKYARVGVSGDYIEMESMIEFLLVKKEIVKWLINDESMKGLRIKISEYYVVWCKFN